MKQHIIKSILFFLFLFVSTNILKAELDSNSLKKINYETSKFKYLLETANQYFYDSLNVEKVSDEAFHSLMKALDPYSLYFSTNEYQKLEEQNKGDAEGIGLEIVPLSDTLTVVSVVKNSPADSVGIIAGDKIIFIDGKSAIGMPKSDADNLIKGEKGTTVQIIIKRQAGTSLLNEYAIRRDDYNLNSVISYFLLNNTKIGYILLSRFSQKTDSEFQEALTNLKNAGMEKLIVDLRSNYGGIVETCLQSVSNFFKNNTKLLKISGRHSSIDTTVFSSFDGKYQKIPLEILVDKNTASASEIFAGIIQDYDRGVIIGDITYGKGTVQKIWKMNDGSGFRITVAEYITPSGRKIQKSRDSSDKLELDPAMQLNMDEKTRNSVLEALKSSGGHTMLPTLKTADGRTIITGRGIFPDVFEKPDTVNVLTRVLTQKGIFLEYVYRYLNSERENLLKKYKDNFQKFNNEFQISEEFLENFKKFSYSKNIWNDKYYQEDKSYITDYLKSLIAYSLWGENGYRSVFFSQDKVLQKAISTFDNYDKILKK